MAAATTTVTTLNENIKLLMEISGLDASAASEILQINDNHLERAINYHLENSAAETEPVQSSSSSSVVAVPHVFDANNPMDTGEEQVRAPILARREQMLQPDEDNFQRFRKRRQVSHNVCPLRNFEREGELHEEHLAGVLQSSSATSTRGRHLAALSAAAPSSSSSSSSSSSLSSIETNGNAGPTMTSACRPKRSRLGDLFRPPVDLSFVGGTLNAVRECGRMQNRWVIVNLQDNAEFSSQVLNRDIWSDQKLKALIKKYFLFWQVAIDNVEGMRFQVFYDAKVLPYVCVIDPRTGEERLAYKTGFNLTAAEFADSLRVYLNDNTLYPCMEDIDVSTPAISATADHTSDDLAIENPNSSRNPIACSSSSSDRPKIEATSLSEEEQLLLAIQNSLLESGGSPAAAANSDDSDLSADEFSQKSLQSKLVKVVSATTANCVIVAPINDSNNLLNQQPTKTTNYEQFLGSTNDDITKLVLRLPDGKKDILEWPCSSRLRALRMYVEHQYPAITKEPYKIICPYPRQDLLELDQELSLQAARLHPSALLHLHRDE